MPETGPADLFRRALAVIGYSDQPDRGAALLRDTVVEVLELAAAAHQRLIDRAAIGQTLLVP